MFARQNDLTAIAHHTNCKSISVFVSVTFFGYSTYSGDLLSPSFTLSPYSEIVSLTKHSLPFVLSRCRHSVATCSFSRLRVQEREEKYSPLLNISQTSVLKIFLFLLLPQIFLRQLMSRKCGKCGRRNFTSMEPRHLLYFAFSLSLVFLHFILFNPSFLSSWKDRRRKETFLPPARSKRLIA